MLSFFQRVFGSAKKRTVAPAAAIVPHGEPSSIMPAVEVARLRLRAILERLPEELKTFVLKMPEDEVTVALPVSTILKQLATGAVKVSLATVHRQAPAGVLGPLPPGDKRLVDVPLAEVFRHVSPQALKRRADQRVADGLESEFNLFGNAQQPYQVAPTAPEELHAPPMAAPARPPLAFTPSPAAPVVELSIDEAPAPKISAPRIIAPPPELAAPRATRPLQPPPAAAPAIPAASIAVPLAPLAGAWPELIRNEIAVLNGSAQVSLPAAQVTAGLARGRVSFTWGEIRGWLQPALPHPSAADDATELTLPLKVIAPVFLVSSRKKSPEPTGFETDIPALFNDRRVEPVPIAETPAPAPAESAPELRLQPATPAEASEHPPTTVGELFGNPGKTDWTPAELVAGLAGRKGVSGAVVALQEGLLVAHSLPADVKSETIAAFLPQIFARLNQYSGEMKLGEVDDLLFTTHGAHCQIYRLGFVYFAVLGKPGEPLPWPELRLVADELARQTQSKS